MTSIEDCDWDCLDVAIAENRPPENGGNATRETGLDLSLGAEGGTRPGGLLAMSRNDRSVPNAAPDDRVFRFSA